MLNTKQIFSATLLSAFFVNASFLSSVWAIVDLEESALGHMYDGTSRFREDSRIAGFTEDEIHESVSLAVDVYAPEEHKSHYSEKGWVVEEFMSTAEKSGFVLSKINEDNTAHIKIVYHGTNSMRNIATDINAGKKKAPYLQDYYGDDYVYAHSGFVNGVEASWSSLNFLIKKTVHALIVKGIHAEHMMFDVMGHSMGAANATLTGLRLVNELNIDKDHVRVLTVESPRVFNLAGANAYEEMLGSRTLRIANKNDIVTKVGPYGGFHVGQPLTFDKEYGSGTFVKSHSSSNVRDALKEISELKVDHSAIEVTSDAKSWWIMKKLNTVWQVTQDTLVGRTKQKNYDAALIETENRHYPDLQEIRKKMAALEKTIKSEKNKEKVSQLRQELESITDQERDLRVSYRLEKKITAQEVQIFFATYKDRQSAEKLFKKSEKNLNKLNVAFKVIMNDTHRKEKKAENKYSYS